VSGTISRSKALHDKSIVVDGLNAVYPKDFNEEYVQNLMKGGVTGIHVTIPDVECFSVDQAVKELSSFFLRLRRFESQKVRLVTTVREIRQAKDEGGIAVVLGSQGAGFLGLDLSSLEFFARLGLRTMQPTYSQRNQFGDGCGEKTDVGLSDAGVRWVEEMNRLRLLISLSHVGYKTSMEIMNISSDPVVFDHSNPKALCDNPRNISDEQIRACAEKGGVIGICAHAAFLRTDKGPREQGVMDYVDHVSYVAELVGIDHVGIGLDLAEGHFWTREQVMERRRPERELQKIHDEFLRSSRDKLYYYEVAMPWLKSISQISIITEALVAKGYSDEDVEKILGGNFLRVLEKVWGA
jgi:membrane dipeptidase